MLVDTSVWIDHFRLGNPLLSEALEEGKVWCHPFVIGELACGNLKNRGEILALLKALPQAGTATQEEALALVERKRLMGRGLGWVDIHLLASALLTGIPLWSLDRPLSALGREFGW